MSCHAFHTWCPLLHCRNFTLGHLLLYGVLGTCHVFGYDNIRSGYISEPFYSIFNLGIVSLIGICYLFKTTDDVSGYISEPFYSIFNLGIVSLIGICYLFKTIDDVSVDFLLLLSWSGIESIGYNQRRYCMDITVISRPLQRRLI